MLFKSTIYQQNGIIDANELYHDINDFIIAQKQRLGLKEDDRLGRHHPLQHILNSTSGGYVSPTSMKSFESCPAGYLVGKLFEEEKGGATSVGRTFHTIMERFYSNAPDHRKYEDLIQIANDTIDEDQQDNVAARDIMFYVENYWNSPWYDGKEHFDHSELQCATEVFIKPTINPLGVNLNVPIYTLLDRVDVTDHGIVVVDYKTGGKGDPNPYLLGENGYLPQMIFYKWAAEAEYGEKVDKVLLSVPGATTRSLRWVDMNVSSLVEQSKVVEKVYHHLDHIRKCRDNLKFEQTFMRYCGSCPIHEKCAAWRNQKGLEITKENVPEEINIVMNVEDELYIPERDKNEENEKTESK